MSNTGSASESGSASRGVPSFPTSLGISTDDTIFTTVEAHATFVDPRA